MMRDLHERARIQRLEYKLSMSLPTFENRPFGLGIRPRHSHRIDGNVQGNDDDDGHDDDGDNNMDGYRRKHGDGISCLPVSGTQTTVKTQRRTYIDVEEAPTKVDVIVKSALEEALFGDHLPPLFHL